MADVKPTIRHRPRRQFQLDERKYPTPNPRILTPLICVFSPPLQNFIVGQVTPDMLTHMRYGTYIFFGALTACGAAFIFFFVPETKGLSLEEMDVLFGSEGTAQADAERMREIYREVGLDKLGHEGESGRHSPTYVEEKQGVEHKTEVF